MDAIRNWRRGFENINKKSAPRQQTFVVVVMIVVVNDGGIVRRRQESCHCHRGKASKATTMRASSYFFCRSGKSRRKKNVRSWWPFAGATAARRGDHDEGPRVGGSFGRNPNQENNGEKRSIL
jgi:hypothetical protein